MGYPKIATCATCGKDYWRYRSRDHKERCFACGVRYMIDVNVGRHNEAVARKRERLVLAAQKWACNVLARTDTQTFPVAASAVQWARRTAAYWNVTWDDATERAVIDSVQRGITRALRAQGVT